MPHPTTAAPLAPSETPWSKSQQRFLAVLQQEEDRTKSVTEICRLAGYSSRAPWYQALEDERFTTVVQALGVATKRHHLASHLEVELATNIEEE